MNKYRLYVVLTFFSFSGSSLFAQEQQKDSIESKWSFSASAYYYFVSDDENNLSLIGYANYKKLHLEARYNYEDRQTGSAFAGWRFETAGKFKIGATPMMGIVFGNTNGIAPGLELDATFKRFGFYSETEYVINFSGKENNFLYTWGELSFKPLEALSVGFCYQRTLLYQTDLEVQRGIMTKYFARNFNIGAYYFNPFSNDDLLTISLSVDF